MIPKRIRPGDRIAVRLSHRDRELILNDTFVGGESEGRIRAAPLDRQHTALQLTLDDLDELISHIAAAANHATIPELRRKLDRLYERFAGLLQSYTDENPRR